MDKIPDIQVVHNQLVLLEDRVHKLSEDVEELLALWRSFSVFGKFVKWVSGLAAGVSGAWLVVKEMLR